MPKSIFNKFLAPQYSYLAVPVASLLFVNSLPASQARPDVSQELHLLVTPHEVEQVKAFSKDSTTTARGKLPEKDGIYLYGQAPAPAQIGQEYVVFEVEQGRVVGAFYLPHSEFSCFQGTLAAGKLALMVAAGPGTEPHPDSIAAQNSQQVAAVSDRSSVGHSYEATSYPHSVALQNYYQLPAVSDNDRRILSTCQNNYQR